MAGDVPELRTFGVVGDVHTEANALSDLLDLYGRLGLGAVLCCGDLLDGNGDPLRCIELLQDHGCYVVRGNHERWALAGLIRGWDSPGLSDRERWALAGSAPGWGRPRASDLPPAVREWAEALPLVLQFSSPMGPVELAHGIGSDDMNQFREDSYGSGLEVNKPWQDLRQLGRANVVVKGHTHRREVFSKAGIVVIDGGTLLAYGPPGGVVVDISRAGLRHGRVHHREPGDGSARPAARLALGVT